MPPPLRLAHVIDSLKRAGTQTTLLHLAEGLAARGYAQRVYCLNAAAHPDLLARLAAAEIPVVILGKGELASGPGLYRLWAAFRRWRPHLVQTFLPFADTIGRTVAHFAGVPAIVSSIRARNIEKPAWQRWLDRRTMPWADRVIFNTCHAVDFARTHEGVRYPQIVCIPNGVLAPKLDPEAGRALRESRGVPKEARVLGVVGRLAWQKGHTSLLQALALLGEAHPHPVLFLAGDGPLRAALEAQAAALGLAGQVHFLGERGDVETVLSALDVYVQPSIYEGMPNALMEAMAAGLPVVATAVDGARELVTDGETGWLVPVEDAPALAQRLGAVLANPGLAQTVGAAAALHMAANFSVAQMVGDFDALYRELAGL